MTALTLQDAKAEPTGHEGPPRFRTLGVRQLQEIGRLLGLSTQQLHEISVVAAVLPFKTNFYVLERIRAQYAEMRAKDRYLCITQVPLYKLVIPARDMLPPDAYDTIDQLMRSGAPRNEIARAVADVRRRLNPHPGKQMELNVPKLHEEPVPGLQHKYGKIVLLFPRQGQTCHAYCTYCFRWAQFVDFEEGADLMFATVDLEPVIEYLRAHTEVVEVLITGGDSMIMPAKVIGEIIRRLLDEVPTIKTIRLGTKVLAYWPRKFVSDPDHVEMLDLFREVVAIRGKRLAVMAHFSHPFELEGELVQTAIANILATGAKIYTQAPLIHGINDSPDTWRDMWTLSYELGMIDYYMFVERDTGPQDYFAVPLGRAWEIFRDAYCQVTGLARTVRGPSMSATPGKVRVNGVIELAGQKYFVLEYLQARNPALVGRPFLAIYDEEAVWFDQLKTAPGYEEFFPKYN
jgi:L-lysine 2,3-aminomutase